MPDDKLEINPAILAWFKAYGTGLQTEFNGILEFYIDTIKHPASESEPPYLARYNVLCRKLM